jgi:hypothetical protein
MVENTNCNCNNSSIINSEGFGISNGVMTIIALLAGFYATNTSKISVIGALLSLLLTDPLSDSYSIYISLKDSNPKDAYSKFKGTFLTQIGIQGIFLLIVVLSSTIYKSFIISSIIGLIFIIYDYNKRLKNKTEVIIEITKIFGLIFLTFIINTIFYKYYKK